jgi:predicted membrane protein
MGLLLGLGLVILGVAFLLSKLGVLGDFEPWNFWPLVLVLAGIMKLFGREDPPGRIWGVLLIGAGVLFQLHYLEMVVLRWDMVWPVLLIVFGLFVLGSSLYHARRRKSSASSDSVVSAFVVLGGKEDQIDSKEFEGGEILAIMGGCNLDLREARIKGEEAVINVKAIMGGVELRVPDDWSVTVRGTPIMGAVEDKTRPRKTDDQEPVQRLVIEGVVLMGGVEVRN